MKFANLKLKQFCFFHIFHLCNVFTIINICMTISRNITNLGEHFFLLLLATPEQFHQVLSEVFPNQDVDKDVTGGVDDGEEAVGEDMEDKTPDRRATCGNIFRVYGLVEVENKPREVAEDEDNHNKESDDKIGEVPDDIASGEDFQEDPQI